MQKKGLFVGAASACALSALFFFAPSLLELGLVNATSAAAAQQDAQEMRQGVQDLGQSVHQEMQDLRQQIAKSNDRIEFLTSQLEVVVNNLGERGHAPAPEQAGQDSSAPAAAAGVAAGQVVQPPATEAAAAATPPAPVPAPAPAPATGAVVIPWTKKPLAKVCIGSNNCKSPLEWQSATGGGVAAWRQYAHPSSYWNEDDDAPFSSCCRSCDAPANCSSSVGDEHIFVKHILPHFLPLPESAGKEHVFLEVRGDDGAFHSSTFYLEHCLRWRGVLVEPNTHLFYQLLLNRPGVVAVNSRICEDHRTELVLKHSQGKRFHTRPVPGEPEVSVPCGPLRDYLNKLLGISFISVLFLNPDEGLDVVLRSLDLSVISVAVIVASDSSKDHSDARRDALRIIHRRGYSMIHKACQMSPRDRGKACITFWASDTYVNVRALKSDIFDKGWVEGSYPEHGSAIMMQGSCPQQQDNSEDADAVDR
mmetsp:Transcript_66988/g.160490  ORF Transcript_66988/g.160490 Transcript_66988/m.160490 type:complete len:478 (-) Transcript_66988:40-1473(-)